MAPVGTAPHGLRRGWPANCRHRRQLSVRSIPTLPHASSLLDGVAGIARALSDGAVRARHPVEAPATAVVRELENGSAAVAAVEHAAPPGAMLSEVVAALERAMEATSSALTDASARCLADPAGVAADLTDLIAERARIVGVVDSRAGLRPSELATWEEREQHLEHLARARLPAPDAELFILRKEAATALRTAANLLALSRSFLRRADPVTSLDQRRSENRAAAGRLGEYIERWRRRIAEDGQRIVASEQAGPFYDRLVGMLLDLSGPDEAWVAAELAKARAAADLLGIGPDEELSLDALRAAVATLDRTVVEYVVRRDELVVWVVRPEGPVRCVRHPVPIVLRSLGEG